MDSQDIVSLGHPAFRHESDRGGKPIPSRDETTGRIEVLVLGAHQSVGRGTIVFRKSVSRLALLERKRSRVALRGLSGSSRSVSLRSPGDWLLPQLCTAAAHPIGPLRYRESG
jgi:hypothetical protein